MAERGPAQVPTPSMRIPKQQKWFVTPNPIQQPFPLRLIQEHSPLLAAPAAFKRNALSGS